MGKIHLGVSLLTSRELIRGHPRPQSITPCTGYKTGKIEFCRVSEYSYAIELLLYGICDIHCSWIWIAFQPKLGGSIFRTVMAVGDGVSAHDAFPGFGNIDPEMTKRKFHLLQCSMYGHHSRWINFSNNHFLIKSAELLQG